MTWLRLLMLLACRRVTKMILTIEYETLIEIMEILNGR